MAMPCFPRARVGAEAYRYIAFNRPKVMRSAAVRPVIWNFVIRLLYCSEMNMVPPGVMKILYGPFSPNGDPTPCRYVPEDVN